MMKIGCLGGMKMDGGWFMVNSFRRAIEAPLFFGGLIRHGVLYDGYIRLLAYLRVHRENRRT